MYWIKLKTGGLVNLASAANITVTKSEALNRWEAYAYWAGGTNHTGPALVAQGKTELEVYESLGRLLGANDPWTVDRLRAEYDAEPVQ